MSADTPDRKTHKAAAVTGSILIGACFLLVGLFNLLWPDYGSEFLNTFGTLYPGYNSTDGLASVAVGTVYGLVSGAAVGFAVSWLHDFFSHWFK
ncbi:MAG TPA: hypothetical protein PK876_06495 [Elusimicrobiota bacterium]|nr:hypothetical protein [Elusimicrobiota bacterium]